MIDYATYQRIQHLHRVEQLTVTQIAHAIALDARTVRRWLDEPRFRPRVPCARPSKLDPYKAYIRRLLEHHPYSAAQILNRLREAGYDGGATLVKDYLQRVRPVRARAFLTLHFAPGECAQVDWGHYGSVNVGNTRRRLSFFVMVLCYSRMLYVEFTVSQTMEHFLGCHLNAFEFFAARVPARIMIDNLKSAVLQRSIGQAPVFNPRYADFARHHRFDIAPCNVGAGHEKGRIEAGVGYVKKNFLAGLDIADFRALNPAARHWLDTVANVRTHGETHQRPLDLFALERDQLHPLPELLYDIGAVHTVRASNRFRVTFDTNRYSVPAEYASQRLTLKSYPERLCIYHHDRLLARHPRSYERHRDFEHPDPPPRPARTAPQGQLPAPAPALRLADRPRRRVLPRARAAPPQSCPSRAQNRRAQRDLRCRGYRPRPRRRLRLRRVLQRLHHQSSRSPSPHPPRALGAAPHPARRPARARAPPARPLPLRPARRTSR